MSSSGGAPFRRPLSSVPIRPRPGVGGTGDLAGLALLSVGAVTCAASFVALPWYTVSGVADSAGRGFLFSDLHANADQLAAPVAAAFFDRLAWGLVALVVVAGLAARVFVVTTAALRLLAFLTAVVGLVLTYYSLAQLFNAQRVAGGSAHSVLHSASYGLYFAFAGYLLLAAGALLGYRRPDPRPPRRPAHRL